MHHSFQIFWGYALSHSLFVIIIIVIGNDIGRVLIGMHSLAPTTSLCSHLPIRPPTCCSCNNPTQQDYAYRAPQLWHLLHPPGTCSIYIRQLSGVTCAGCRINFIQLEIILIDKQLIFLYDKYISWCLFTTIYYYLCLLDMEHLHLSD